MREWRTRNSHSSSSISRISSARRPARPGLVLASFLLQAPVISDRNSEADSLPWRYRLAENVIPASRTVTDLTRSQCDAEIVLRPRPGPGFPVGRNQSLCRYSPTAPGIPERALRPFFSSPIIDATSRDESPPAL